jgi:hypothetical protein
MKLLLNDKEIANYLLHTIGVPAGLYKLRPTDRNAAECVQAFLKRKNKVREWNMNPEVARAEKKKFASKLKKAVANDLTDYRNAVKQEKFNLRNAYFNTIHKEIETLIEHFGEDNILKKYKKSDVTEFVKGCGLNLDPKGQLMRRHKFTSYTEDCVIRNTVGNEELLVNKIDNNHPMWFIDSGYTNFLEQNKKWHRLVRNHLHYGEFFQAPADRLGNFKTFPKPWREDGEIIYVIEPGPFAASVFHCDLKTWKYDVARELRQYTDKRIKFRSKAPKRQRTNLYKELADDDYCCVVSINSNAATEAIWQGVPAITLGAHVTNPVTVDKLSDINNLYRGPLGEWLCMLSYQQFTKEEIVTGTAGNLVKKYTVNE